MRSEEFFPEGNWGVFLPQGIAGQSPAAKNAHIRFGKGSEFTKFNLTEN
jgi:hypothetical protein